MRLTITMAVILYSCNPAYVQTEFESKRDFVLQLPSDATGIIKPEELIVKCSSILANESMLTKDQVSAVLFQRACAYLATPKGPRFNEAKQDLDRVLKLSPTNVRARCIRAMNCLDNFDDALREIDAIVNSEPRSGFAFHNKGMFLILSPPRHLDAISKGVECASRAISLYQEDSNQAPSRADLTEVLAARATGFFWLGEHAKALIDANRALELGATSLYNCESLHILKGKIFLSKGNYRGAMEEAQIVLQYNSHSVSGAHLLIDSLVNSDKIALAKALAESLVKDHPRSEIANRRLFYILFYKVKAKDQAIALARKAVLAMPKKAWPHRFLCIACTESHDYEKAASSLEMGISKEPKDLPSLCRRIRIWTSCPEEKYRNGAKARELAISLCGRNKDYTLMALLQLHLAFAYAECRQFDKALEALSEAERYPRSAYLKGQISEVRRLFQRGMPFRFRNDSEPLQVDY